MATRLLASLGVLIACVVIAFGVGYLIFNLDGYDAPPSAPISPAPASASEVRRNLVEDPSAAPSRNGLMVIDALHRNSFREDEISALRSRFASRGYNVEFLGSFRTTTEADRLPALEEKLRRADTLIVALPRDDYTDAEASLVERFVRKGGKLLLIADPTRIHYINTLAERFGVNFQPDYLYNQHENDLNFQNIFIRDIQPEALTAGVNGIAMYTTGSIVSAGPGVAFTDANTESSVFSSGAGLATIAWGNSRNVLAVADFTFIIPPQSGVMDNDQLLSNIADYFTVSTREYELADFPHFYRSGSDNDVDIVLGQPSLLASGTALKNGLAESGIFSGIRSDQDASRDTVFLGLHEDALQVSGYLQAAGIRVDETLGGHFGEDLPLEGTTVTVLDGNQDRHALMILADTPENLDKAVAALLDGKFRQNLVSDFASVSMFETASKASR